MSSQGVKDNELQKWKSRSNKENCEYTKVCLRVRIYSVSGWSKSEQKQRGELNRQCKYSID